MAKDSTPSTSASSSPVSARRKNPAHPNTWEMIKDALFTLNDRQGTSYQSMLNFFERFYSVDTEEKSFRSVFSRVLRDRVEREDLVKVRASYRLSREVYAETKQELERFRPTLRPRQPPPSKRNSRSSNTTSAAARAKNVSPTSPTNRLISKVSTSNASRNSTTSIRARLPAGVRCSPRLAGCEATESL